MNLSLFSIKPFQPRQDISPIVSVTPFQPNTELTGNLLFQNINRSFLSNIGAANKVSLNDAWKLRSLDLDPRRLKAEQLFMIQPAPEQFKATVAVEADQTLRGVDSADTVRTAQPTEAAVRYVNPNIQLQGHQPQQPQRTRQGQQDAPKYQQWEERKFLPEKEGFLQKLTKLFKLLAP